MLRNALITAVAATLMGGFVLALQGIAPQAQRPAMDAAANGEVKNGTEPADMDEDQAQQQLRNGGSPSTQSAQMLAQSQPMQGAQLSSTMGSQGQSSGMQQKPMMGMGMCPMMGMMGGMGGQMNQSGQSMQGTSNSQQAALQAELEQLQRELAELKRLQGASSTDKRRR